MSYTAPSGNAVDFVGDGVSYTAPAGNAVDFTLLVDHVATSLGTVTQFGTPLLVINVVSDAASVSPATQFGTPSYVGPQFADATGFSTAQLGSPIALLTQSTTGVVPSTQFGTPANIPNAVGFCSTLFGSPKTNLGLLASSVSPSAMFSTPFAWQHWRAFGVGRVAKFGTPQTAHNRTETVSGFVPTRLGTPRVLVEVSPNSPQYVHADGAMLTTFGEAAFYGSFIGMASGFYATQYSTPKVSVPRQALSLGTVSQFGSPTPAMGASATGFARTLFGTATCRNTQQATHTYRQARFGTPKSTRSNAYETYGFSRTWFGHPSGAARFNHTAIGIHNTQLGSPAAINRAYRMISIAPVSVVGKPLLLRTPLC